MAANIETMFYTREKPWHGLGTHVSEAPTSGEALQLAGLDWHVKQKAVYTDEGIIIPGYKANVRDSDDRVLGIVTDRYKVIQNEEAFAFTDSLLGNGVRYETAGSLSDGRRIWLLAKLSENYVIAGDRISPYLVFTNTHDGSGAVRVALTPIRVVCNNTLNLALNTAKRCWSMIHTGNIQDKMREAEDTLFHAERYMDKLGEEIDRLAMQKISDREVTAYIEALVPIDDGASAMNERNVLKVRNDIRTRYYDAPDLSGMGNNAYRFINAVSDFATHAEPLRKTARYKENRFVKTIDGNPLIDKAYQLVRAAA